MKKFQIILIIFLFFSSVFAQASLKKSNLIDTKITSAPPISVESNQVKFEFQGIDYSNRSKYFYFQTKLWPLENKWQTTYSNTRYYYDLPPGRRFYIFYVRAINDKNQYDPTPAIYIFITQISSFYGKVSISPNFDQLNITLQNNTNEKINITNWQIRTSKISYIFGKGVRDFIYDKNRAKFEDIILTPYGRAIISAVYSSATSAPVGISDNELRSKLSPFGFDFLNNKCFLYIDKKLSDNFCDSIINYSREELYNKVLKGEISRNCAILIESGDCDGSWLLSRVKSIGDIRCQALVEDWYNYNSCYQRRHNEKDFFGPTWYIYFDPRDEIDKQDRKPLSAIFNSRYDRIVLYDNYGLIVADYKIY